MRKIKNLDDLIKLFFMIVIIALFCWAIKGAWLFALDQYSNYIITIERGNQTYEISR